MKHTISREPPSGAPEGTVWFGGPVDRFKITLRISGEELDPDRITALLDCRPSRTERKGVSISGDSGPRIPKRGQWLLTIDSRDCHSTDDVEDGIRMLLAQLPSDAGLWASLTSTYAVDVFCGLFLASSNRGFCLSA